MSDDVGRGHVRSMISYDLNAQGDPLTKTDFKSEYFSKTIVIHRHDVIANDVIDMTSSWITEIFRIESVINI